MKEAADLIISEVVECKSNPDISTKERRIGLIFAVGAFVHSGRLPPAIARSATQGATVQLIIRFLTELSKPEFLKQVQILELTIETILSLVQLVPKAQFQSQVHPIFAKLLSTTADELQPEIVSLALGFSKHFGYHLSSDNPQLWNRQETIFGARNILNLNLPLTVTVRTVPRVHKVWSHMLETLLAPSPSQEADFARFTNIVLDALLSSDSIDHNYLAFQVVASALPQLNAQQVEVILSAKLLSVLFVNISRRKSLLAEASNALVEACTFAGTQNPEIALAILRRITGPYGDLTVLDHFIKPGVVHTLVQSLDAVHLQKHLAFVFAEFTNASMPSDLVPRMEIVKSFEETAAKSSMDVDEDVSAPNENVELRAVEVDSAAWKLTRQEALVHYLQRIALWIQSSHVEVARKILNNIFFFAFYTCTSLAAAGKTPKKGKTAQSLTSSPQDSLVFVAENIELDAKVRTTLSTTLLHLIDSLKVAAADSTTDDAQKRKKHTQHVDEAPFKHTHFWVWPLVQFEKSLLDTSQNFKPITGGKELDDIRSTAESLMAKIEPVLSVSDETRRVRLEAFQSLLIHLHLMINIELEDSIQSIQDLARVFEELFMDSTKAPAKKTPSKKSKKQDEDGMDVDENAPEPIEVFTEILVALLLKAGRSLRHVIEQNWVAFATLISDRAFDVVLTALEEDQDAEEDEGEDDENDLLLQLGSDVEVDLDGSDIESGEEDGEELDADDDDDDDDDDEEENDVDALTKQKLKEVLMAHGAYGGSDGEDSDEEILNDEQMFAMDASLAKVVKEIQAVKQTSKRKRENKMTNIEIQATEFRMRLLALVDLYIEQQTSHHTSSKATAAEPEAPAKKTPTKSPKKPAAAPTVAPTRYHTTYLNVIWPFVRIVDLIASKKALAPLMTRVLASVHRLVRTRLPSAETSPLSEKQIESFYTLIRHLYAGFNQPSRPAQVDMRLGLLVFLLRILLEQPKPDVAKLREGFLDAVRAHADASQTAIKSRSLFTDLFPQILRRVPALQLVHLKGIGDVLAKSREGPTRGALTIALFSTITRGIVEAELSASIEKIPFKKVVSEFSTAFKACFADAKMKGLQQRELLLRATELFKISLALAKGDLKQAQADWNHEELLRFTGHVLLSGSSKPLPAVALAHESFAHYLEHGKPKQTSSKYASADEKLKAKMARREARGDASKTKLVDEDLPTPSKDGAKKRKAETTVEASPKKKSSTPSKK